MEYARWPLPKGDIYIVRRGHDYKYYSIVQREKESTIACHGTNYWSCIKDYYSEIFLAQQDVMNGTSVSVPVLRYWQTYRGRMSSRD